MFYNYYSPHVRNATLAESNNSSTNNALFAKSTGIKNIDDLYAQMLKSKEYVAADKARTAFGQKVKFHGIVYDINTTPKLLAWIGAHLSTTNFTSVAQAQAELNNIHVLSQNSYNANIGFYNAVGQQSNYVQTWNQLLTSTANPGPDPCGCVDTLLMNYGLTRQYYSEALQDAFYNGVGTMAEAEDCYALMLLQDGVVYQDCLDNC